MDKSVKPLPPDGNYSASPDDNHPSSPDHPVGVFPLWEVQVRADLDMYNAVEDPLVAQGFILLGRVIYYCTKGIISTLHGIDKSKR